MNITRTELFDVDDKSLEEQAILIKQNQDLRELIIHSRLLTVRSYRTLLDISKSCKSLETLKFNLIMPTNKERETFNGAAVSMFNQAIKSLLAEHKKSLTKPPLASLPERTE